MILVLLIVLGAITGVVAFGVRRNDRVRPPTLAEQVSSKPQASGLPAGHDDGLTGKTFPKPIGLPQQEPAGPSILEAESQAVVKVNPGPEVETHLFSGLPPEAVADLDDIGRLDLSVGLLQRAMPELSASRTLTRSQIKALLISAGVALIGFLVLGHNLLILILIPIIATYLAVLGFRLALLRRSLIACQTIVISDEEALAVPDWRLPVYTVLVPAFHEPEVMERIVKQLRKLVYPRERLDIKLLLEADDADTIAAAQEVIGTDTEGMEVVLVPAGQPRTKPKALNFGLTTARGQLLTIYDAEDRPDPLQLRRAAIALGRLPDDIVCLQAKLLFFNPQQNLITRWFAIEYKMWFAQLLPGLVDVDAPVPLGGTSNHFRCKILTDIGGWDPFNVTEDADLGIRLHRLGFRTAVLDSVTYEEANSDFINWIRQRSRWYKGYLQTWLVNMRHPRELRSDLGWKAFILFNLFVGGTPLLAILNPVFWVMTIVWFVSRSNFILSLFPMPVYYAGLLCLLAGNFAFVYATMLSAFEDDEPKLVMAALLTPFYWMMMAVAATKAALQIVISPSYWEKTYHGLDVRADNIEAPPSGSAFTSPSLEMVAATLAPTPGRLTIVSPTSNGAMETASAGTTTLVPDSVPPAEW